MKRVGSTDQFGALRGTVQGRRHRWVRPSLSVLEDRMMLAAYTVISNSDTNTGNPATGTGTLRWAINQLDANGGPSSTIAFDLPSNELTIIPGAAGLGPLPQISEPVDIEGQTQPNFAGRPLIVINGASAGSDASGLTLAAGSSNSVIQDLVIDGFTAEGIQIASAGDQVDGCYLGTDAGGTVAVPNFGDGIVVGASNATIGGTTSGDTNVISGNGGYGIAIDTPCLVEGNKIGTDAGGTAAVPNSGGGILVEASNATIGGTASGDANIISGNGGEGIAIIKPCLVEGNEIGTDAGGTAALANSGDGILVRASNATIGGTASGDANVISGNGGNGILIIAPCLVEGNEIGTNAGGTAAVANFGNGIFVDASNATIGGTASGDANVISGNGYHGIFIEAPDCLVAGNEIGTDAGGTAAVPNAGGGIVAFGTLATGATIGGTSSGDANVISGNGYDGVDIAATDCLVAGNEIGTDASGTAAVPNSSDGISVDEAGATIGGTASGDANVISGNGGYGVFIDTPCLVVGNEIGTDAGGTAAVPNSGDGIFVEGSNTTIGGTASGDANVISGNGGYGVDIDATDCLVAGNEIGTDASGTSAVGNSGDGIAVEGSNATIGGSASGDANVISGNGGNGIAIVSTCLVEGNEIGTDADGTAAVANSGDGILVRSSNETIGGTTSGDANVISGNGSHGIFIAAPDCLVEGNEIGTDAGGTAAVPNSSGGIFVIASLATGATIGGSASGDGNVISGNGSDGVFIEASDCLVAGNEIGTDAGGTAAVPNSVAGIFVANASATIGGTASGDANVISGNAGDGIVIDDPCLVEGNLIGTDRTGGNPVPNQGIGVYLDTGSPVAETIGAAGAGNIIAFNGGPGVATSPGTNCGTIRFNVIFSNGGPGIDLNDDGVTPNTPNGANNTPILASASGGIVTGELNAAPNSIYIVDIYANLPSDASAKSPQGREYLTSTTVTTNLAGDAVFNVPYTPYPGEPTLTATATDAAGAISEFSPPLGYVLSATGVTFAAMTHVPFQGTVAAFSSSDSTATAADFTATINYGDGTPSASGTVVAAPGGFLVVGAHTFTTANPIEPVTVTITDTRGFGQATANSVATITSPGGLLTPFGQSVSFVAGTLYKAVVASFTDSSPLAVPGEFTASINWGDGTASSAGTVAISGAGFKVSGSHTYNDDPVAAPIVESVTVTITDTLTGDTVTANTTATVAPVPIIIQVQDFAVTGGKPFSGTVATFTDGDARANPAFYTATINWGDGSPNTTGKISGTNPFTVTASHKFAPFPNTDLVTITISDNNGRTATGVDRVVDPPVVSEPATVAPTGTAGPAVPAPTPVVMAVAADPLTVAPNKPFQGIVATFSDSGPPQPASAYKATINWGKGRRSVGMITGSNGRFVVSARHVFPRFTGEKTVTVTVSDGAGQVVSVRETVSEAKRQPRVIKVMNRANSVSKPHR
jgi:hypothetical protein